MRKNIYFFILLLVSFSLFSNELILKNININGLKRTKENTVLKIINKKVGDKINPENIEMIEQKLKKSGLFTNDIEVILSPINKDEANLDLVLTDKWTLIPLPLVYVSGDNILVGGFFIESNLFGLKHSLMSGVMYSDGGLFALSAWGLPPMSIGDLGLFFSYTNRTEDKKDFWDNDINAEDMESIVFGGSLQKSFVNYLDGKIKLNYKNENGDGFLYLLPTLSYDTTYIQKTFSEGFLFQFGLNHKISLTENKQSFQIVNNTEFSKAFLYNLFLVNAGFGHSFDEDNHPLELGGSKGSNVLASDIKACDYITFHMKYEVKLVDFGWGYLTLPIYYEAGIIKQEDLLLGYNGPGIGILTYLNKVALPAVGVNFVYDFEQNRYKWGASIGISM